MQTTEEGWGLGAMEQGGGLTAIHMEGLRACAYGDSGDLAEAPGAGEWRQELTNRDHSAPTGACVWPRTLVH